MLKTIIDKEFKEYVRDTRFKISFVIVLLMLSVSFFTGINQYRNTVKQYQVSKEKERAIWDNQSSKNPHSAAHDGTYVFKPKNSLSLLDNGVNDYTGNVAQIEAHNRNDAKFGSAYDETDFSRNYKLSINFVLLYIFPLLIFLIGFNSITKEKELETLRMLKSQGLSMRKLVLGKWVSVFLIITWLLTIIFIFLFILLKTLGSLGDFSFSSFIMMYISYLLYYAVIVTLSLLVSVLSKTSGISLVFSLALWVLFCFMMPKIATNIANQLYAFPSKQEFKKALEEDKNNGFNGHDPDNEKGIAFKNKVLEKYGVATVEELPFNYTGMIMQKAEEEASKIYTKHYGKLKKISGKQNKTYETLAFLSPFISIRLFSMDLSRTGYRMNTRFDDQTDIYRIQVQKFLNDDMKNNSKMGDWSYKMKAERFKELAKFSYKTAGFIKIMSWNFMNIILLFLWFIIPFLVLLQRSKKI